MFSDPAVPPAAAAGGHWELWEHWEAGLATARSQFKRHSRSKSKDVVGVGFLLLLI